MRGWKGGKRLFARSRGWRKEEGRGRAGERKGREPLDRGRAREGAPRIFSHLTSFLSHTTYFHQSHESWQQQEVEGRLRYTRNPRAVRSRGSAVHSRACSAPYPRTSLNSTVSTRPWIVCMRRPWSLGRSRTDAVEFGAVDRVRVNRLPRRPSLSQRC